MAKSCARGQHHERDHEADHASDRDFDDALEGRGDRARMRDGGPEEDHDRGERRGAEARIERGEQHRGRKRDRECREYRELIVVRNERPDCARVDGAAQRADQIVGRGLERPADADLRQDHRGQHRPQRDGEVQQLRGRQGHHRGGRAPHAQPQLRTVAGAPSAQPAPTCCQWAHAKLLGDDVSMRPRLRLHVAVAPFIVKSNLETMEPSRRSFPTTSDR